MIDERIAERELEESDDLGWAKPLVDEGLAALERGEFISLDEHKARNAARLAALKGYGAVIVTDLADADTAKMLTDIASDAGILSRSKPTLALKASTKG